MVVSCLKVLLHGEGVDHRRIRKCCRAGGRGRRRHPGGESLKRNCSLLLLNLCWFGVFKSWIILQYEYDYNENGDRVVLGRGTYGVVYAGRDLSNQVRIAIKEIPERDSRWDTCDNTKTMKRLAWMFTNIWCILDAGASISVLKGIVRPKMKSVLSFINSHV